MYESSQASHDRNFTCDCFYNCALDLGCSTARALGDPTVTIDEVTPTIAPAGSLPPAEVGLILHKVEWIVQLCFSWLVSSVEYVSPSWLAWVLKRKEGIMVATRNAQWSSLNATLTQLWTSSMSHCALKSTWRVLSRCLSSTSPWTTDCVESNWSFCIKAIFVCVNFDHGLRCSGFLVQVPEGNGSGFIWDEEGHIVTNYHGEPVSRTCMVALINV